MNFLSRSAHYLDQLSQQTCRKKKQQFSFSKIDLYNKRDPKCRINERTIPRVHKYTQINESHSSPLSKGLYI